MKISPHQIGQLLGWGLLVLAYTTISYGVVAFVSNEPNLENWGVNQRIWVLALVALISLMHQLSKHIEFSDEE